MKSKIIAIALLFLFAITLFGCAQAEQTTTDNDNTTAQAEPKEVITWKVQGFTPAGTLYDDWGKHLANLITELSGGRLVIEWYPSGAIVPAFEAPAAVRDGILDAEFGYSGIWAGIKFAAPLFTATPGLFSDARDMLMWLWHGGGMELWSEMVADYNVVVFPAGLIDSEIFMWSNEPLRTLEDLKGKKLRMMPLMGKILEEKGYSVVFLPGGEIIPSLERGVIDAAEYSIPAFDITLGFQDVAKYYHFPAIHQPSGVQEFVINKDKWNALPDDLKRIVEYATQINLLYTWTQQGALNIKALEEFEKMGLEKVVMEEEAVKEMMRWIDEWFAEKSKEDPFLARVRESQIEFAKWWFPYKQSMMLPYPDWALEE